MGSIALKLDHCDAFPLDLAEQRHRLLGELRVQRLSDGGHTSSTGNRKLLKPAVLKHGQRLIIVEKYFDPYAIAGAEFLQQIVHAELRIEKKGIPQVLKSREVSHLESMLALILFAERLGDDRKSQPVPKPIDGIYVWKIARLRGKNSAGSGCFYGLSFIQHPSHDFRSGAADMEQ